jgi:cell division protein FtsZ
LIVIPNQNLFRIANERTTFAEAFRLADEVLHSGVRGITDLMVMPGFMNLDFADVKTVMGEMGKAMMGTGEAEGDNRAICAAEAAISNPLLDDISMKGARGVLINITGGLDMTLFEVDQAANRIREEVDAEAQTKVGSTLGEGMDGRIRVSVIATGIEIEEDEARKTVSSRGSQQHITTTQQTAAKPAVRVLETMPPKSSPLPSPLKTNPVTPSPMAKRTQVEQEPLVRETAKSSKVTQPKTAASSSTASGSYFSMPASVTPKMMVQKPAAPVVTPARETEAFYADDEGEETVTVREQRETQETVKAEAEPTPTHQEQQRAMPSVPPVREIPPTVQQAQRQRTAPAGARTESKDMRVTQLTPPAQENTGKVASRSQSLFQRITGFGLVRPSARDEEEDEVAREIDREVEAAMRQSDLGVDPSDRPVLSGSSDSDLLDIPAFLRRQSNH